MSSLPRVVVTNRVHPDTEARLKTFCDPVLNPDSEPFSRETLLDLCREAEGLMVFMNDHIDEAFLELCPKLRVISAALKGYDNFDTDAILRRKIHFVHVPDLLTVPTAELTLGLMISLARNIPDGDQLIRDQEFAGWRPVHYGTGLEGETASIIGMGRVGLALAERLVACGMKINYVDQQRLDVKVEQRLKLRWCGMEEALHDARFLIPFVPLTPKTRYLINAEILSDLPKGAFLINCCRGSVVCESDVADALESGQLQGYAADVFEMEDWALEDRPRFIEPRLLEMKERTLFTPHLGSAVVGVRREISLQAANHLESWFGGTAVQTLPHSFV